MRIAQIAPLMESVPPRYYGGTERVVSHLCEELVSRGHDVTLFASGDSVTAANLVACTEQAVRLNKGVVDHVPHYMIMLDKVRALARQFDILHFHIDAFQMPLFRDLAGRTVTTLHGRQDLTDIQCVYRAFPEMPLVSISNAQRDPISEANFAGTIYHGLPLDLFPPTYDPRGGYLAFLGRMSVEKRPDRAIEIASALGLQLKMAAKVDKADEPYFREVVAPLIEKHDNVQFIGEIGEREKRQFLGEARAMLFPIDWPEPFGLVMIEAMSCATPVLAFKAGSSPEIIDEGVTGCLVDSMEQAIDALRKVLRIDRRGVRRRFEERFSSARMADDYVDVYKRLIGATVEQADTELPPALSVLPLGKPNGHDRHAN